jgi:hypothetical protein
MRVWLRRDPRVASMADFLAVDRSFMNWMTDPVRRSCDESVYECVTGDVTRSVTVASLLEVWGVARERGWRDGDDLVVDHCSLMTIDDICGTPSFGLAMESVDWAIEEFDDDRVSPQGNRWARVRFPRFFEDAVSPEDRHRMKHRDRQARYRAKKRDYCSVTSDVTRDATVTHREEKRREEFKKGSTTYSPSADTESADGIGDSPTTPHRDEAADRSADGIGAKMAPSPQSRLAGSLAHPQARVDWKGQLECWNALAGRHGLTKARKLTDSRKTHLGRRLHDHPELWREIHEALTDGRVSRETIEQAWFTIEWIIKSATNLEKVLEGTYRKAFTQSNGYDPLANRRALANEENVPFGY